ncbi:MAG: L,D-transpeptidase family protein [Clostridiales bacterium]|jgi:L,D-peptidoglycan transpeptidase YkuD (ErfK/YbiS/YcfS/YnhG family)|nr:L,D-transpeptidase family protein [Clostridiales bacterium]
MKFIGVAACALAALAFSAASIKIDPPDYRLIQRGLNFRLYENEELLELVSKPLSIDGRAYFPLREFFESTGANVEAFMIDGEKIRIKISLPDSRILHLSQDSALSILQDQYIKMERPILLQNGIMYFPIADLFGLLGYELSTGFEEELPIESTKAAAEYGQIITVTTKTLRDAKAVINAYEKTDGRWSRAFSDLSGVVGQRGISYNRTQGDKTTPGGVYSITWGFGILPDPGVKYPYRLVDESDYWVGDSNSDLYNTYQSRDSSSSWSTRNSEHLIEYEKAYDHAAVIDFNLERKKGIGGGIFLHALTNSSGTAGCVALESEDLLNVLKWIDPEKRTAIIICPESELRDF